MTWVSLLIALLKLASGLFTWLQSRQLIDAGADHEIAKASAAVLVMTSSAKKVMEEISALSSDDTDKLLRSLVPDEPADNGQLLPNISKDNTSKG